ncbi:MAG: enoyl-CoA hydratase/isomerase family protein [Syntrophobacterales bacterium]|nr:MAG: enoyl-CoA hydratase/isomerase family protein [Syntrophobacterales bacterium]
MGEEAKTEGMRRFVSYTIEENLAWVTIDNPPLNALNHALMDELSAVFKELEENENVLIVILQGGGERAFAAGADIKQFPTMDQTGAEKFSSGGQDVFNQIENFKGPVIAAIQGFALGGGCELAMACDIRVASEDAKFGQPEINLALIPGYGGTQRMPRLIAPGKAKELIYTGEMIDAMEASRIGLADRVVKREDLLEEAKKLATKILAKGPLAVKAAKKAINEGLALPLREGLKVESRYFGELFNTEDKNEGALAFLEKRKPIFKGK